VAHPLYGEQVALSYISLNSIIFAELGENYPQCTAIMTSNMQVESNDTSVDVAGKLC